MDAAITALLPQASDQFENECNRIFASATVTEFIPPPASGCFQRLQVKRPPIASVTSLHFSSALPRVYDATTVLVEGTDFIVSESGLWVTLEAPRYAFGSGERAARLIYVGGFSPIPDRAERAVQELLAVKLYKATGRLYHIAGSTAGDGSIQGARFDDITENVQAAIDFYRIPTCP